MVRVVFVALAFLGGCSDSYDSQFERLSDAVDGRKIGNSVDYWLVKNSPLGDGPVALIFGFVDDLEFCQEVAQLYMSRYPADRYICTIAN